VGLKQYYSDNFEEEKERIDKSIKKLNQILDFQEMIFDDTNECLS
jgi:hypothetical protein